MTEGKIECPNCGSKNCFEEPLQNNVFSYLCVGCGYTSNTLLVPGTEIHNKAQKSNPKILNDLKYYDEERNIHWYPSTIQTTLGMLFPEGFQDENGNPEWGWNVCKVVELTDEEKGKYPAPRGQGYVYEARLDVENGKFYAKENFYAAIKDLGVIQE